MLKERLSICTEQYHDEPPFEIVSKSGKSDRHICVALKDFAPGDIILKEKVFI
jgi:hypothetical protein